MKVRDIIKPQMTTLRFMHSNELAEYYFQITCHEATILAREGEGVRYHPYSFKAMRKMVRMNLKDITGKPKDNQAEVIN